MAEDITVAQAMACHKVLENGIKALLIQFNDRTGLLPTGVILSTSHHIDRTKKICDVTVTVEL
jgi:hypothetical protein